VAEAEPDLSDAEHVFRVLRAYSFAQQHEKHLANHRDLMKQTVIWNTEEGLKLSALDVAKAEEMRTRLWQRVVEFFGEYDFLCLPVTSVPPFSVEMEYPETVAGKTMSNYLEWMWPCYLITATGCPAVSVPAGFTPEGLPVGLQIVGKPFDDFGVLQVAHAFEQATKFGKQRPKVVA
jgi:amidase